MSFMSFGAECMENDFNSVMINALNRKVKILEKALIVEANLNFCV